MKPRFHVQQTDRPHYSYFVVVDRETGRAKGRYSELTDGIAARGLAEIQCLALNKDSRGDS